MELTLSKKELLDLIKILAHYDTFDKHVVPSVGDLCQLLEDALLSTDVKNDDEIICDYDGDDLEKDDDERFVDSFGSFLKEKDDDDEDEDLEEEEDDHEDDEDDHEEILKISSNDLHDLKPLVVKSSNDDAWWGDSTIKIEFQQYENEYEEEVCELTVDGNAIGNVTKIKRESNELKIHLSVDGNDSCHVFSSIKKMPKQWSEMLTDGVQFEVEE